MVKLYFIDVRKFKDKNLLSEAICNASLFRREKYEMYKYESSKLQSIAVTFLLDQYLKTIGIREKEVEYEFNKYGKPSIKGHLEIKFSLSHSDNFAMAAFSEIDVGCDIEKVQKIDRKLMEMVLSDDEIKRLMQIEDLNSRYDEFFRYWVMKEAIIKKNGLSIGHDLKNTHENAVYVGDIFHDDIGEKYYFAVYDGTSEIPKVEINMV